MGSAPAPHRRHTRSLLLLLLLVGVAALLLAACSRAETGSFAHPHGPVAEAIMAPLGDPLPTATPQQLAAFEDGRAVSMRRFDLAEGLGPAFNVTSCTACHERPVNGGSSGLYRNFFLAGTALPDGSFVPASSAGESGGVIRMYAYGADLPARPPVPDDLNVIAQRNAIHFFGVGLIAELPGSEILSRADPDDADGDGISGRANFDRGFVGRFGRKAQTVSIEAFIRGPLFNHLGITTDPLTDEARARLPVDSSSDAAQAEALPAHASFVAFQAAAPDGPLTDSDGAPDPELSGDDLFALVSHVMLLAAPELEEPTEQGVRGAAVFDAIGCGACHTPRLDGRRGPLPVYSDLLLHDMGPELADGIVQNDATGHEFRTHPLWGLAAVGPYLHDGRAATIRDAILAHGGEAQNARDAYAALTEAEKADLEEFLLSLGGRSQLTPGLLPADAPIPPSGEFGAPLEGLSGDELEAFRRGRLVFDRDHGFDDGAGAPGFNGDSCRACHFDPVIGGSGPRDVNVIRHGFLDPSGEFTPLDLGQVLPKLTSLPEWANPPDPSANVFEHRQTPPLFGLGLVDDIPEEAIVAGADPDDADGDGISGRVSYTADGRVGRFGWKADVPSLTEFVRDALGTELGMTLPPQEGLTFGRTADEDAHPDPEFDPADAALLVSFMRGLAPPPRAGPLDGALIRKGEEVFSDVGCASCHVPSLPGASGPVELYSDLLLHDVLPAGSPGIAAGSASTTEFRTAPLWGLRDSAPYLHSGAADTIEQAILAHDGEAAAVTDAYRALTPTELEAITAFLRSL